MRLISFRHSRFARKRLDQRKERSGFIESEVLVCQGTKNRPDRGFLAEGHKAEEASSCGEVLIANSNGVKTGKAWEGATRRYGDGL